MSVSCQQALTLLGAPAAEDPASDPPRYPAVRPGQHRTLSPAGGTRPPGREQKAMCMVGYVDLPEVLDWFKSPFSGSNPGGNCVEVAGAGSRVAVRDSKD